MLGNLLFYYFAPLLSYWFCVRHWAGALAGTQVLGEHLRRVYRDEKPTAARQHLAFSVQDLGYIHVLASAHRALTPFDYQTLPQRYQLQIFHVHGFRDRDHRAELVHFAHGFVEDGGNNASMGVTGRALEAQRQTKA